MNSNVSNFESLVAAIAGVHERLHRQAIKAVNVALTLDYAPIREPVTPELAETQQARPGER